MHIGIMQILDHTYFLLEATLMTIITKNMEFDCLFPRLNKFMKDLAIFGINDSFAGQVVNFLPSKIRGKINCLISSTPLSDIKKSISFHTKSHDKIEYPKGNKIFWLSSFS